MSTTNTSSSDDEALVNGMLAFCDDIFSQCFIMDPTVRRTVARMLLDSGKFVDFAGHKFDMIAEATQQFSASAGARDPFSMQRQVVAVCAGLTHAGKTQLITANQDVELRFRDTTIMPHGVPYAQRVIDTQRCLSLVDLKKGDLIDIGGNFSMYSQSPRKVKVHCCTKRAGELEWHRHITRHVNMHYAGIDEADYCTDGAESCDFQALHGISIHTIPNIDPQLWPLIFKRHGMELLVGVFHYDVAIESEEVGFIPEANMHWYVKESGEVHFYFEDDSSHGYDHRRDWLIKYGSNWMATLPDWDYVVYYQVDFIEAGRAQATLTRLDKSTLGAQEVVPQYRFLDIDEMGELIVPKFNPDLGLAIRDPRAYELVPVRTPMALISYLYKFGIANDTENPTVPLSADRMREHAHMFNHVRKVNGTDITIPDRQSHALIDDVAIGMYLLVVKRVAMNKVIYGSYTDHMLNVQKRWGEENVFMLAIKSFSYMAIAPFLLLADTFQEAVDLIAVHMRATVGENKVLASLHELMPYRRLPPMRPINAYATAAMTAGSYNPIDPADIDPEVSPREFYEVFKDTMDASVRKKVEEYLRTHGDEEAIIDADKPLPPKLPHFDYPFPEARDKWLDTYDSYESYVQEAELPPKVTRGMSSEERINPDRVWDFYGDRVFEYALTLSDEGLHTLSNAKELCTATWTGTAPNYAEIAAKNVQEDAGIAYFRVSEGVVLDMDAQDPYAICLDPVDGSNHKLFKRTNEVHVAQIKADYIFVCESFRIFNNFDLGRKAYKMAVAMATARDVKATLMDGIAGCGKTFTIESAFTLKDIILVTVRSTADSILARMKKDPRFEGHTKALESRIRTLDSANLHSIPAASVLFVDEGLMPHSGALVMAMHACRPNELRVFGDSEQVQYIRRGTPYGNLHFESLFYWTQVIEQNVSARIPADAAYVSATFYPEERRPRIKTYNPILRSIIFVHDTNVKGSAYTQSRAPFVYITILRGDRGKALTYHGYVDGKKEKPSFDDPNRPVLSVHEAQGETFPFVFAFRMNIYNASVLSSTPHLNVMFTRHMVRMVYQSPNNETEDKAAALAIKAMNATDEELRNMQLPAPEWVLERHMKLDKQFARYL